MKAKTQFRNRLLVQFKVLAFLPTSVLLLCLAVAGGKAQTYSVLYNFGQKASSCARLALSGETLYGTTEGSGLDEGSVFKLNTDGSDYAVIKAFAWAPGEGQRPTAGVLLSGGGLYGSTSYAYTNNGQLFWVGTNGSGFTVLKYFNGPDGAGPLGLILSGASLYGTTRWGGYAGTPGTIFRINTNGDDHVILHDFYYGDEYFPTADLVLADGVFYGTTTGSGTVIKGSVFRMNTNGSGYRVLKAFTTATGSDGLNPEAGLVLSGTALYGTTSLGGLSNRGTLFTLQTDGSGFTVLKHFTGKDGATPKGSLLLVGRTLVGTTEVGGIADRGTIFKLNTDGSGFMVVKEFTGPDGGYPRAGLLLSNTNLYGTTYGRSLGGGGAGPANGVVFKLSLTPPMITTAPSSQTAEIGSTVAFAVGLSGFPTPECQWFFNGAQTGNSSTQDYLELTNIQSYQAGAYVVVCTNALGGITSAPALLNVIPAVERRPVVGIKPFGEAGSTLNLEYTEALDRAPAWRPLATVSLASPAQFEFDLAAPAAPQRFYRAWQTGAPSVIPSLDLHMIPALTLTGSVDSQVRVDGINQFGPIDAWFTLDTVTLTNSSQLYFDVSVIGQPQRLYRLVPVP